MKWIGPGETGPGEPPEDEWDDTVLLTQDSKFEPWRSEAEHATSRSRRLPTILTFTRGWGRNIFVSLKPPRPGTEPRTLAWKAAVLTPTLGSPPLTIVVQRKKYPKVNKNQNKVSRISCAWKKTLRIFYVHLNTYSPWAKGLTGTILRGKFCLVPHCSVIIWGVINTW